MRSICAHQGWYVLLDWIPFELSIYNIKREEKEREGKEGGREGRKEGRGERERESERETQKNTFEHY